MSYISFPAKVTIEMWDTIQLKKKKPTTCRPEFMGPRLSRIFSEEKFQTDKV